MESETSSDQRPVISASEILAKIERGEDVEYDGRIIEGELGIRRNKVITSTITITNSEIQGIVNFGNARFQKPISFAKTKFCGDADFRGAKFTSGDASFEEAKFTGGLANFHGAKFTGGLANFVKAEFGGDVNFVKAEFGKRADLREAKFTGGSTNFRKARFGGVAGFRKAKFIGGFANFMGAKFTGGGAYFEETEFTRGDASFEKAEFTAGLANFPGAKFIGGDANFKGAKFGEDANFDGTKFTGGKADFDYLQFHRGISFRETKFGDPASQEVACRIAKRKMEDLGNKKEADDYFYREMKAIRIRNGIKGTNKLTWPWKIQVSGPDRKSKVWLILIGSKIWRIGRYDFFEYVFIQGIFGYGVRPLRLFGFWILMALAFALIYWYYDAVDGASAWFDYIWFSIATSATPGYALYNPIGHYKIVTGIQAIIGTFMWAAFIGTFARKWQR